MNRRSFLKIISGGPLLAAISFLPTSRMFHESTSVGANAHQLLDKFSPTELTVIAGANTSSFRADIVRQLRSNNIHAVDYMDLVWRVDNNPANLFGVNLFEEKESQAAKELISSARTSTVPVVAVISAHGAETEPYELSSLRHFGGLTQQADRIVFLEPIQSGGQYAELVRFNVKDAKRRNDPLISGEIWWNHDLRKFV